MAWPFILVAAASGLAAGRKMFLAWLVLGAVAVALAALGLFAVDPRAATAWSGVAAVLVFQACYVVGSLAVIVDEVGVGSEA